MAEYFPPRPEVQPTIYAYSNPAPDYKGLLKVGYTTRTAEQRIKEQFNIKQPKGLKPYTLEGETVLDFTIGSGTTAVACVNTNRKFIGIEQDEKYIEIAKKRVTDAILAKTEDLENL